MYSTSTFFLSVFYCFSRSELQGQTILSGVHNTFTPVTAIDQPNNQVTVGSTSGFFPGDTFLIIQHQGADINTTNSSAFGDVTNYNSAGLNEVNVIESVSGNDVQLRFTMTNSYQVAGGVQMVDVPNYQNVQLSANLASPSWNGSVGG